MNNTNYYEVCITIDNDKDYDEYWICIKGIKEPTVEEANTFLKRDVETCGGHVTGVYPIDEFTARGCYDFDKEEIWPVFGID